MPLQAVAVGRGKVELKSYVVPNISSDTVRVRTVYSLLSQGTELNTIAGGSARFSKSWSEELRLFNVGGSAVKTFPVTLGYNCVGRVAAVGVDVARVKVGDMVWLDRPHQEEHVVSEDEAFFGLCPQGIDPKRFTFRVPSKIALAGVHDAHPYIGSTAVVTGLGVIGQLSVELLRASGVSTIFGVDPSKFRRDHASGANVCALDPAVEDAAATIKAALFGRGADFAIEASGTYSGLATAIRSLAIGGRAITVSTYTGPAGDINLGEEYHRNRIELISSMSVNGCPHRGSPLWDIQRLQRTSQLLLERGVLAPERHITREISFFSLPDVYDDLGRSTDCTLGILVTY
jgi:threonine dehydrogenase-like Zn-dependent dehydrogenase